jgi:hypothetical protein
MPTKERKIKEQLKTAYQAKLDHATNNAPAHVIGRLHKPSILGTSLCKKRLYKWRGLTFDEQGQPIEPRSFSTIREENQTRHNNKLEIVANLFSTYKAIWGKRGMAKPIAYEIGCSADTVRRYFRDFPEGI